MCVWEAVIGVLSGQCRCVERIEFMRRGSFLTMAAASAALLGLAAQAGAATLLKTYTGSDASGRSATAAFYANGTQLEIDLTNNGDPAKVLDGTFVLTALWFNLSGATPTLASASMANEVTGFSGQIPTITSGPLSANSFWGSPTGTPSGFAFGVGAAGNPGGGGSFGQAIDGTNVQGSDGGILPTPNSTTGYAIMNNGTKNQAPFAEPTVVFLFNLPGGFSLTANALGSTVKFGYGTASTETSTTGNPPPVPLPAAVWSGLAMLGGLGVVARLRRKSSIA